MKTCSMADRNNHRAIRDGSIGYLFEFETGRLSGRESTTTPDDHAHINRGVIYSATCDGHDHSVVSFEDLPLVLLNVNRTCPMNSGLRPRLPSPTVPSLCLAGYEYLAC